jgi:hypothetical protein
MRRHQTLLIGLGIGLAACDSASDGTAPSRSVQGQPAVGRVLGTPFETILDEFNQFSNEVPEFAGVYVDATGVPVVLLTDLAAENAARGKLATRIAARSGTSTPMRAAKAQYSFKDLLRWRLAARSVLSRYSVVSVGIDDRENRVRIGVTAASEIAALYSTLESMGVPRLAVDVRVQQRPSPVVTLRDYVRPVRGGLKIATQNGDCSYGFSAILNNYPGSQFFITASHCTPQRGVVDSVTFYQPTYLYSGGIIGTEVVDPAPMTGYPCPGADPCRYSDAAAIQFAAGVSYTHNAIARTMSSGSSSGSITISSSTPNFTISWVGSWAYSGTTLQKIGQRTGWTYGNVDQVCIDFTLGGWVFLCTFSVNGGVGAGDSGAPVFYRTTSTNVSLYGIVFAGLIDPYTGLGNTYYYSTFGSISTDMGGMAVFY